MRIPAILLIVAVAVSGCVAPSPPVVVATPATAPPSVASFAQVVARVEPVAEKTCLEWTQNINCDFRIEIDARRGQPPNAFQSLDKSGRPVITFTASMIADTRNPDELAFVMGHEAAHHIEGHLARQEQNAAAGAVVFAGLATLTGGSAEDVRSAMELGAAVGARSYSKEFELEADSLGTIIAYRAGFDPILGAAYFTRIPDPGNQFLGTHPPNSARMQTVLATAARLGIKDG
ncbi:MAG: M48 family metalloprotease [Marinibacterium sp.]